MPERGKQVDFYRRADCRLCQSRDLECVMPLAPSPVADDYVTADRLAVSQRLYPMDVFICRACGHVQLLDVVNPEILFRNYTYVSSVSLGLVEHFRQYADSVTKKINPTPGSLIVEMGSNSGALLRFFKEKGFKVLGVDPAQDIARRATEEGIETWPTFFTSALAADIVSRHGKASLFCANNVFAHADDLSGIAEGVRNLLSDDGVFIFEVAYVGDLVKEMIFDSVYHEHLSYHAVKPLVQFLQKHGLQMFDVQRSVSKGGSLRCFAQVFGGRRSVEPSVASILAEEEREKLTHPTTYHAYFGQIGLLKEQCKAAVRDLKGQGRRMAGFGASATVTTLLYHFDLIEDVDFLVDDNTRKQGAFSPGCHLPVFEPSALLERKIDTALILAWRYAEPIMKKNQAFLAQGRQFLLPLPKVALLS